MRDRLDLFIASILVLFLELACIRWFPAHVLFLTFFTNVMLLAAFLGISVGCLAAGRRRNYLVWTPVLLLLAIGAARLIEWERQRTGSVVQVGNSVSPQLVFFGVEYQPWDPSKFVIPIEAVSGVLFILVALALVGPGQQLGRSLARVSNRVEGYTVNIAGSIAGILLFTACSWWELGPVWWFGGVLAAIAYFQKLTLRLPTAVLVATSAAILLLMVGDAAPVKGREGITRELWSPYYRIHYGEGPHVITVNLIGHQQMSSRNSVFPAYAIPHLFNRDSGRPPFGEVLVIGAGSGNDVSRALQWGATHVDAVEIDPVIYRLGRRYHPDQPYLDGRVTVHLDDGRNYLRSTDKQYDLIVYALVDSLVLHSSYSNIRLESYLFTTQAFADIHRRLKPGGVFVMYNYFRQGWIVGRLHSMLEEAFGTQNPIVFNLPSRSTVRPDDVMFDEFTMMFAGATGPIKEAFAQRPQYWVRSDRPLNPSTPNGFDLSSAPARTAWAAQAAANDTDWIGFAPTTVVQPEAGLRLATDSWPFLYLRRPMIPDLSLRGSAIMGVLGALLVLPFVRRPAGARAPGTGSDSRFLAHMFFLGAGFMLLETKAVVQMALLFGGTWMVNSIVFCAVLTMILLANLFVLAARPRSLAPFYAGLALSLAASAVIPLDAFLGLSRALQIAGSCTLAFTPVFFAGVVFALSFSGAADADRAFGANVAGAMFGGLSEYSSMLLGFQYVVVVALGFYACSAIAARWRSVDLRPNVVVPAPSSGPSTASGPP
jgi:spermidine synthase